MLTLKHLNPSYLQALKQAGLTDADKLLGWNQGERLVKKQTSSLFRCAVKDIGYVYLKIYLPDHKKTAHFLRTNYALREYRNSMIMASLGIEQPESLMVGVVRDRLFRVKCGVYITREVEGAVSLDKILRQKHAFSLYSLDVIVDAVIRTLQILHSNNYCHWDFKPRNILVAAGSQGARIIPIDSRSLSKMYFFNRKAYMHRDYKYLLREPLLQPFLKSYDLFECSK